MDIASKPFDRNGHPDFKVKNSPFEPNLTQVASRKQIVNATVYILCALPHNPYDYCCVVVSG